MELGKAVPMKLLLILFIYVQKETSIFYKRIQQANNRYFVWHIYPLETNPLKFNSFISSNQDFPQSCNIYLHQMFSQWDIFFLFKGQNL